MQDGYSGLCDFHGGVGGIKTFALVLAPMAVSKSGMFSATTKQSNSPFKGTTTLEVSGKLTPRGASCTVTVPGDLCGSGAGHPKANLYFETFTAKVS